MGKPLTNLREERRGCVESMVGQTGVFESFSVLLCVCLSQCGIVHMKLQL